MSHTDTEIQDVISLILEHDKHVRPTFPGAISASHEHFDVFFPG
jgi:hypothetical protein